VSGRLSEDPGGVASVSGRLTPHRVGADRLGYRSEAAFARALTRVIGTPPGAVRRTAVI
jgi:hypothetical protein